MEQDFVLRPGLPADLRHVLAMNETEARWTSYIKHEELAALVNYSTLFSVAVVNSELAGFLIVISSDSGYPGANYRWFQQRYSNYWYVDRIVVVKASAGLGIGRGLYEHSFQQARRKGVESIACEYSTRPMNEGSEAFHRKMGFREVGIRQDETNDKVVSMQLCDLSGQSPADFAFPQELDHV